jgi:hypothetical protein
MKQISIVWTGVKVCYAQAILARMDKQATLLAEEEFEGFAKTANNIFISCHFIDFPKPLGARFINNKFAYEINFSCTDRS